jgi:CheY-like chemotaxis protein/CheY-specific phosphatase CheX
MYTKFLHILAETFRTVLEQMAITEVLATTIKKDERLSDKLTIAAVVEYEHLDKVIKGHFIFGFNPEIAVPLASSISENMGLEPITQFDESAQDIIGELLNTIVGRTVSEWDRLGMPVRFGPPKIVKDFTMTSYTIGTSECHMIILTLEVSHVVLRVTFTESPQQPTPRHRILIVDDSSLIRKVIKRGLDAAGYITAEANDGLEAVRKHKDFDPELTIMDLVMPELGGLEAIIQIQQGKPEAKFIVLTSASRTDEIVTAKTLGVTNYFLKPLKMPDLVETIRKILGEK